MNKKSSTFSSFIKSETILKNLSNLKFKEPTPIQILAFPAILQGNDVLAIAETGSGKTAAFCLPIIAKQESLARKNLYTLILEPTKEMVKQTVAMLKDYTKNTDFSIYEIDHENPVAIDLKKQRKTPSFIVSTTGSLLKYLESDSKLIGNVTHLILDEADKMVDSNFLREVKRAFYFMPKEKQVIMFTSTMTVNIERAAKTLFNEDYQKVLIENPVNKIKYTKPSETIKQYYFPISKEKKLTLAKEILKKITGQCILFTRTQARAEKIYKKLKASDLSVAILHGGKSAFKRDMAMKFLQENKAQILITTDLVSRGIDLPNVNLVINFDMPQDPEVYIHRIGRTGRAGREGQSISFIEPTQIQRLEAIQKLLRAKLMLFEDTTQEPEELLKKYINTLEKDSALKIRQKKRLLREKNTKKAYSKDSPPPKSTKKYEHTKEEYVVWKRNKRKQKKANEKANEKANSPKNK